MKSTQLLDARRNIRKEIVAFISIVMIGLLAALAYLGIAYSAAALKIDGGRGLPLAEKMLSTLETLPRWRGRNFAAPGMTGRTRQNAAPQDVAVAFSGENRYNVSV